MIAMADNRIDGYARALFEIARAEGEPPSERGGGALV